CRSRSRFSSLLDLALRDLPSFPTRRSSDLTKTKGHKRCLTVGGVQGVYFVLQRLEGIVALFDGTRVSVTFGVRDVPLFCGLAVLDRKSTRLNSSHVSISYAVFCLKTKLYLL